MIGNNAYAEVAPLQKAVADAQAVAEQMEAAGYHTVLRTNVDRRETNLAIFEFTRMLDPGGTRAMARSEATVLSGRFHDRSPHSGDARSLTA